MNQLPTKTSLISIDTILNKASLKEGSVVADFGCGRSTFFLYALSKLVGKNGLVYGIDILPEVIDSLQHDINHHKLSGIKALRANLEADEVVLPEGSLSAVFIINTLSQSSNCLAILKQASHLLGSDGKIIIVDWNIAASPIGPALDRRLSFEHINEMLAHLKLKVLDRFEAGPYHYGITVSN